MDKTLIIVPSAGFGTRIGMTPNSSKELLVDPNNDNKPLIEWCLDLTPQDQYDHVIITREAKQDLIDYLCQENKQIFTTLINKDDESKEWPNSVLQSKIHWTESNILVLPDTRFQPTSIIKDIEKELQNGADLVFAIHKVDDVRQWGKVFLDPFSGKPLTTQEKPNIEFKLEGLAWGVVGFKSKIGEELFQAYLERKTLTFPKTWKVKVLELQSFKDITRNETIEPYDIT